MLQKTKRLAAVILSILMCISMFTCIVLPASFAAEDTTPVSESTDPYAAANDQATALTVTNGKVITSEGYAVTVPAEYQYDTIYDAGDKINFYDPEWTAESLGIEDAEGSFFLYRYGNDSTGSEWGNGKVYLLKWRVNAFGATQYESTYSLDGTLLSSAASYSGWSDLMSKLRFTKPVVGEDNSQYVILCPGTMSDSTGSSGSTSEVVYTMPDTTAAKNATTEFEKEDYTNVYFLGPQAGRNPTSGVLGDETVNNYRSDNAEKEIVFTSTFWGALDAVYHIDGIALSGTNKVHVPVMSDRVYVSGLYMTNVYFNLKHTNGVWCTVGTNNTNTTSYTTSNTVITAFHLTNSYFYSETANSTGNINYLQANDLLFDNVVMNNINCTGDGAQWRFEPCNYEIIDNAFLGEYRNDYHAEVTNCTFKYTRVTRMFSIYNAHYTGYSTPDLLMENNYLSGYVSNVLYCLTTTASGTSVVKMRIAITLNDNYIKSSELTKDNDVATTISAAGGYTADNGKFTLTNNTFVAGTATQYTCDLYSTSALVDASGNLFMTHEGNVRAARGSYVSNNYTSNFSVLSDLYVSDEMVGGVKELFNLQETAENAIVTYSNIQLMTLRYDTADYFRGAATLVLKDGETFNVNELFTFKDENVKLVGFYDEEECENQVSDLRKGFGTVYAKFEYKTDNTKATVLYTIIEPSVIRVVDPGSVGSYTFNGTTYTASNAVFYSSLADACAAVSQPSIASTEATEYIAHPSTDVILLMPGNYAALTIEKSVSILGPKTWEAASDGTSADRPANRNSSADEANFTAKIVIQAYNNVYCTIAGIARYMPSATTAGQDGGRGFDIVTRPTNGAASITIKNVTMRNYGSQLVCNATSTETATSTDQVVRGTAKTTTSLYMTGCHFGSDDFKKDYGTSSQMFIYSSYTKFENCTFSRPGSGYAMRYFPLGYNNYVTKPAHTGLTVTGCYFDMPSTDYATIYPNLKDTTADGSYEGFANGVEIDIENNIFKNNSQNILHDNGNPANVLNITFTGNTVEQSSVVTKAIVKEVAQQLGVEISNNTIINYSKPWQIVSNASVDENYYGDSNGDILVIEGDYGYDKSDWYYMDKAMTLKTSSFAVDIGGQSYNAVGGNVVTGWQWTGNLPCGTTTIDADAITASSDAELVGVFADEDCTQPVSGVIENAPLYAKTSYSGRDVVIVINLATAADHAWDSYEVTVQCTCTDEGTYRYTCANCADHKDEQQQPYGHYYVETAVKATCTANAGIYDICLRCDDNAGGSTFENTALGHNWSDYVVTTEGSCVIDKVETRYCLREDCGAIEEIRTPAPDHSWSEWTQTLAPTCDTDGTMERYCIECGAADVLAIAAAGHKYQSVTVTANCYEGGATYDECTVCGDIPADTYQTTVATGNHSWSDYVTTAVTCNAVGVKERFCKVCNVVDADTREITAPDSNAHVYGQAVVVTAGTCEAGATMLQTCTVCKHANVYTDSSMVKGECKFETVTTMPTTTQTGKIEKICSVCGNIELVRLLARSTAFTDVEEGKWYVEYISKAVAYGLLKGYNDNTVRPNNNVTRAEAVTLIARVAGVDTAKYSTTKFSDVAAKAWYNGAVAWAEQNKIVSGRSETVFDPNGHISRQELCTVLVRYANYADITLKADVETTTFTDDAMIAAYAKENVYLCQKAGIVNGKTGNRFDPLGKATRAETAKILVTFMDDYVLNK